MSRKKNNPRRWTVVPFEDRFGKQVSYSVWENYGELRSRVVCHCPDGMDAVNKADANVLSASFDMLNALEFTRDTLITWVNFDCLSLPGSARELVAMVDKVIAKAKGVDKTP